MVKTPAVLAIAPLVGVDMGKEADVGVDMVLGVDVGMGVEMGLEMDMGVSVKLERGELAELVSGEGGIANEVKV